MFRNMRKKWAYNLHVCTRCYAIVDESVAQCNMRKMGIEIYGIKLGVVSTRCYTIVDGCVMHV